MENIVDQETDRKEEVDIFNVKNLAKPKILKNLCLDLACGVWLTEGSSYLRDFIEKFEESSHDNICLEDFTRMLQAYKVETHSKDIKEVFEYMMDQCQIKAN